MSGIRSFEYYLNRYKQGISYVYNTKYDDTASVKQNNLGVDMYRKAAKSIWRYYPDRICEFAAMLDQGDKESRLICAVCIIELMDADSVVKEHALEIVKNVAESGNEFEKYVWRIWLNHYSN